MKTISTLCKECDRQTVHKVHFSKRVKKVDEFDKNDVEISDYMTIECAGCKTVSFLRREAIPDPEDERKTVFIDEHYPTAYEDYFADFHFMSEEDQHELPNSLYSLYEEVKEAFNAESNILAGIGLRTLVEATCLQQKIPGKNLKDKIWNLHSKGLISSAELPILDKLRLIGNMSTHEIKGIPLDKLDYALEIINHVLKSIYILPKVNRKLKIK